MTTENKSKFTVIDGTRENITERHREVSGYQTNPLREKLIRFVNNEAGPKFSVDDLLKW